MKVRAAAVIALAAAASAGAQTPRDSAAALGIALTPASTAVVMNPSMFGEKVRGGIEYTSAHKPFWRTSGIAVNIANFRIQAGRGKFALIPRDEEYYVGLDYGGVLATRRLIRHLDFVVGGDASLGYGAEKFQQGYGFVAETTGGFVSAALRATAGPLMVAPYFAPGIFRSRFSRVFDGDRDGKTGWRATQGGGVRLQVASHFNAEFAVRKTRIGDAIPRYGMSVGATALPLPAGVPSNVKNLRIEMDNDYFSFRIKPAKRPDEDYTNGLRVSFDRNEPLPQLSFLSGHRDPCSAEKDAGPCSLARVEFGQEIYTPLDDAFMNREYDRRYAGWLYGSYAGHVLSDGEDRVTSLTLGVVGPQSLAKTVQTGFHALFPWYRHPNGWQDQLAFEPGVVISTARRYLVSAAPAHPDYLQLIPEWRVSAGNVFTGAIAKATVRVGYHVPAPWTGVPVRASNLGVFAFAAAREDFVLRNIFLDGNTFRGNSPVKHEPWVWQGELGLGLRAGFLNAEYRSERRQREYRVQNFGSGTRVYAIGTEPILPGTPLVDVPRVHPYGSLSLTINRSF